MRNPSIERLRHVMTLFLSILMMVACEQAGQESAPSLEVDRAWWKEGLHYQICVLSLEGRQGDGIR